MRTRLFFYCTYVTVVLGVRRTSAVPVPSPTAAVNRRNLMCALGLASSGCLLSYEPLQLSSPAWQGMSAASRASAVFCNGPLLDAVQRAGVFGDCKVFVDSPLKVDPEEALRRFALLPADATPAMLRAFVHEHFERPGADLVPWAPVDYTEAPLALARLKNDGLREWALALNRFWSQLGRATSAEAANSPERRTLLPLPHPFVVPGGRFVETYYWDSFWIIKGLLTCGMRETAKGMVLNLLHQLESFGFVPNGGRLYYLNRSQPPMLSDCVLALMDDAFDLEFVRHALPLLRAEYAFWMDTGDDGHAVRVQLMSGESATLNRYVTSADSPRPESYLEDMRTASHASVAEGDRPRVWSEIAAAAESGWDFSSRWMEDGASLHRARTSEILPVDLNAIMYRFETNLQQLSAMTGDSAAAMGFAAAARTRERAMSELMWSESRRQWLDVHWESSTRVDSPPSVSNWLPLWAGAFNDRQARLATQSLRHSPLLQSGGVATTLARTEHQWDWPNAWAPLQEMLIEGLERTGHREGHELALRIARAWTASNLAAWRRTHYMYEKYSAPEAGVGGGGGEYTPQVGFGWSNGVALSLLGIYGDALVE